MHDLGSRVSEGPADKHTVKAALRSVILNIVLNTVFSIGPYSVDNTTPGGNPASHNGVLDAETLSTGQGDGKLRNGHGRHGAGEALLEGRRREQGCTHLLPLKGFSESG